MKISNILDGWKNFISKSEVTEKLASDRALECIGCEHAKFSKSIEIFVKDDFKEIEGYVCMGCDGPIKCPLSAKIRSINEQCPIGKW